MLKYSKINWLKAACRNVVKTDIFYVWEENRSIKKLMNIDVFRNLCTPCPIWRECMRYSLESETYGVWAGTTSIERQAMRMGQFNSTVARVMSDFEVRGIAPDELIEIVDEYQKNHQGEDSPRARALRVQERKRAI